MERLSWKSLLDGLGIFALVASLLFVGYQLQQDRQLAAAQVIVAHDANQIELSALISENRDIWLRGLRGEQLSAVDDISFRAVAGAHFQKHQGVFRRMPLLGFGSFADTQAAAYAFDLYQYPSLRRIYVQNAQLVNARRRYLSATRPSDFVAKVDEFLAELDKAGPDVENRTFFPY